MEHLNLTTIIILAEIMITLIVIMGVVFTVGLSKNKKTSRAIKKFIDDLDTKTVVTLNLLDESLESISHTQSQTIKKPSQEIKETEKNLLIRVIDAVGVKQEHILKDITDHIDKINKSYFSIISYFVDNTKREEKITDVTLKNLEYRLKVAEETLSVVSEEYIKLFNSNNIQLELKASRDRFLTELNKNTRKFQD